MTLHQVEELTNYWAEHPPVHISVAAYLGIGAKTSAAAPAHQPAIPPAAAQPPSSDKSARGVVMFDLPGFSHGDIHAGTLEDPIFDFAAARAREEARYSKRLTDGQ